MLVKGNSKLGKTIWQFSIPAGSTCPGRTKLCSERCYAQKGFFLMPSVQRAQERNEEATRRDDFVEQMVAEICTVKAHIVRIHVAGDYYSAAYVKKWREIVKACPDVRFFTYTRSWHKEAARLDPALRTELTNLSKCKNVRMWWSVDAETGPPEELPKRIRCAYLAINKDDIPDESMHLVFRDYPMRGTEQKRINGVMVCPPENGVTHLTCEKCGFCWRRDPQKSKPVPGRMALPLIAA